MAKGHTEFMMKILEDLKEEEMTKLKLILNKTTLQGQNIPSSKLEKFDAVKATELLYSYYLDPLKALESALDDIPRKDLSEKIHDKIKPDRNKDEAQNNEMVALTRSCPISNDHPTYTGKYTLFDLQDYAIKNQDQLIARLKQILERGEFQMLKKRLMCKYTLFDLQDYAIKNQDQLIARLKQILERGEFQMLKKRLMCSVLNKSFSFTAQKYYELFRNTDLNAFVENVHSRKKSQKISKKLLDIMFCMKKNNHKKKAQEQRQREGTINLKENQSLNIPDDDDDEPDENIYGTENEKKFKTHVIEHGNEEHGNELNEHGNEFSECGNEEHGSELNELNECGNNEHGNELNLGMNSSIKENNTIEGNGPYEDSGTAIKKWYEKKKENNPEEILLNYIVMHEHKAYCCFIAQDVIQFKLPDDSEYCILTILQDKRDLTVSKNLKKNVVFELQFNMAVLDVQYSEVISSGGFFQVVQADDSFAKSENFLKDIVVEIVLPVLALYKKVKLKAFQNIARSDIDI
ncbi:uncharacterized protein LOC112540866 [Python bivittatus]|uniref:Uncharacterized protein LOC112540866 n=1 Tax=Python bivittatus TaxID=176946 RepID=A0A9F5IQ43_PYTBI|nr:uncharacterized protein LOC112540866 [Python bivittatus]